MFRTATSVPSNGAELLARGLSVGTARLVLVKPTRKNPQVCFAFINREALDRAREFTVTLRLRGQECLVSRRAGPLRNYCRSDCRVTVCPCCERDRNELLIHVSTNGAPCRPRFRSSGGRRRTREREQVVPEERLHRRMRSAVWRRLQPRIPGGEPPRLGSPSPMAFVMEGSRSGYGGR